MENNTTVLKEYIHAIQPLSEEAWSDFSQIWTLKSYGRKEVITNSGTTEDSLYFVMEGVQRIFYYDDQDREATLALSYPHSFTGVVDSFLLRQPSKYNFETLSSSQLLKTSHSALMEVSMKHSEIAELIQLITNHAFAGVLERMVELQCFSSTEKFKKLLQRSPQVLQLVPHKYLANYLGINPTNFSKLLNSVKI